MSALYSHSSPTISLNGSAGLRTRIQAELVEPEIISIQSNHDHNLIQCRLALLEVALSLLNSNRKAVIRFKDQAILHAKGLPKITLNQSDAKVFLAFTQQFLGRVQAKRLPQMQARALRTAAEHFVSRFKCTARSLKSHGGAEFKSFTVPATLGHVLGRLVKSGLIDEVRTYGSKVREYLPSPLGLTYYASISDKLDHDHSNISAKIADLRSSRRLYEEALRQQSIKLFSKLPIPMEILRNWQTTDILVEALEGLELGAATQSFFRNASSNEMAILIEYALYSALMFKAGRNGWVLNGGYSHSISRGKSDGKRLAVWERVGLTEVIPNSGRTERQMRPTLTTMAFLANWVSESGFIEKLPPEFRSCQHSWSDFVI